jgi:uncharacterized protein
VRTLIRPMLLVLAALALAAAGFVHLAQARQETPHAIFTTASGSEVRLNLEVADTPEKQTRGLMDRESMPEDQGMVFVFERVGRVGFWMQNTYIPLSIAFVDESGRIVDILDMQPLTTNINVPSADYKYAIEVNQGYFARNGIQIGDTVRFHLNPA